MLPSRMHKGLSILILISVLTGCATPSSPYRVTPDLSEKKKPLRTIELLPPQIEMYEYGIRGTNEKLDYQLSLTAKKNVAEAVSKWVYGKNVPAVKIFPEGTMSKEAASTLDKISNFDSLSKEELKELNTENADALLMVSGVTYVLSPGYKVLKDLEERGPPFLINFAINVALAIGIPRYTPINFVSWERVSVQENYSYIRLVLIDPDTGSILWYQLVSTSRSLLNDDQVYAVVDQLLYDFPVRSGDEPAEPLLQRDTSP
jgi:hypothetical protein